MKLEPDDNKSDEDICSFDATRVVFEGDAAKEQQGLPHGLDGHVMDVPEWNAFQVRYMVDFVFRVLAPDQDLKHVSYMDKDTLWAYYLSGSLVSENPEDLFKSARYNKLLAIPIAKKIMVNWFERLGRLFRETCKIEGISMESASGAVEKYHNSLVPHVWELRRLMNLHADNLPSIVEVLVHVRSQLLRTGVDDEGDRFLEFGTMFPYVETKEGDEAEPFRQLASQVHLSSPEDPYSKSVTGDSLKWWDQMQILLSEPGKTVVLDSRPVEKGKKKKRRFEKRLVVHERDIVVIGDKTGESAADTLPEQK